MKKGKNPVLDFFRKLGLILLKNLLYRKNQFVVTTFEILFPIIGYLIMLSIVKVMTGGRLGADDKTVDAHVNYGATQVEHLDWTDRDLKYCPPGSGPLPMLDESKDGFIAYTPNTQEYRDLLNQVADDLCGSYSTVNLLGVDNEEILEDKYSKKWEANPNFPAAVVFTDGLDNLKKSGVISYKIRMSPSRLPSTSKILPKKGEPDYFKQGPNKVNQNIYKDSGFLALQRSLDKALTKSLTGKDIPRDSKIYIQPFPYPSYKTGNRIKPKVIYFMYFFYAWGLCFMIPSITRNVVGEKETGVSELLRLTGVSGGIQWLGWFIHVLTPQLIVITILATMAVSPVVVDVAILENVDWFLFWIILLLYVLAAAAFGFFVCSLCQKPTIATTVLQLIWVVTIVLGMYYLYLDFVGSAGSKFGLVTKLCLFIFPNMAFAFALYNVQELESRTVDESDRIYGVQWSILFEKVSIIGEDGSDSGFSTGHIMALMLAEILVYMTLALYLESVLPSEHGVKRPWYLFKCKRGKRQVPAAPVSETLPIADVVPVDEGDGKQRELMEGEEVESEKDPRKELATAFESEPVGAAVGVDIQGLVKRFGRGKVAVNGVFLRMFSGDIFALLGHNGAGKTTLISMLTGFFSPSGGTAFINGYDIRTDLGKARNNMGLCPQHNMLFDWLTVSQQISLFGMLRGLSLRNAKNEARALLLSMRFFDKSDVLAKKLSGGQKRKLSLAMALIGGTKVVVLDEPTSGMDPQARREIWDILLQLRGERTILLTTHFMEEADVLGDRIGIMANGQLQCCGSAAFLKKYYGTGYTLKLTMSGENKVQAVEEKPPAPPPPSASPSRQTAPPEVHESQAIVSAKPSSAADAISARGPEPKESKVENVPPPEPEVQEVIAPPRTFKPSPEAEAILTVVQTHVPDATFKQDARIDQASHEVFITLPALTATTTVLSKLFADLTARKDKLLIQTIGLSQTTMDEVFVKVGSVADEEKYGTSGSPTAGLDDEGFQRALKSRNKFICQFTALLMRKFIYCIRRGIVAIIEALIPLLLFMAVVHLTNNLARPTKLISPETGKYEDDGYHYPEPFGRSASIGRSLNPNKTYSDSLKISLDTYKNPITIYSDDEYNGHLAEVIGPSARKSQFSQVEHELLQVGEENRISYKRRHIIAAKMTLDDLRIFYNLYPYHSAPLAINIATNALLKSTVYATTEKYRINVENHPFPVDKAQAKSPGQGHGRSLPSSRRSPFSQPSVNYKWRIKKNGIENYNAVVSLVSNLVPLGLLFLVSTFIVMPVEERLNKAKQLQTMTGVNPLVYWGAAFCWDYLYYLVIVLLMVIYLLVFEFALGYGILSKGSGWLVLPFILMFYGFSAIFLSYLLNFGSSSVTGAFSKVTLIHLITGIFLGSVVPDNDNSFYVRTEPGALPVIAEFFMLLFHLIGRLFPTYSLVRALWFYAHISAVNNNCPIVAADVSQCVQQAYLKWSVTRLRYYSGLAMDAQKNTPYVEVPGILQELFWMTLMGALYVGLLMFIEFKIWGKIFKSKGDPFAFPPNINDEDVYMEMERVNMLMASGEVGRECMVVQNLSKSYGNFAAVSQLSFGVHYGECFGLLGVNGAGKTTAFRMITGDEQPTMGTAYGFGTSLDADPKRFFAEIGYCPQFDGILPKFTGKEMLQLFAGLRGVPFKLRGPEAMRWLTRFGLEESANVRCGRYSGGMKRRLSTAMAMIGDPMLILLDEPTSGVDPVSRRQFWKILDKMRESGQSIILTSHSMEECEALCSRLGIMVNGQFQCFGGVQHLKNKFAQGYSLTLKLKPDLEFGTPGCDEEIQKFEQAITERFQPCALKDKHQNLLQYHLQNPSITWEALFKTMEEIKTEFEALIEDYSVNETSLEEVFLAFARVQHPERRANVSLCKQICTCSC